MFSIFPILQAIEASGIKQIGLYDIIAYILYYFCVNSVHFFRILGFYILYLEITNFLNNSLCFRISFLCVKPIFMKPSCSICRAYIEWIGKAKYSRSSLSSAW